MRGVMWQKHPVFPKVSRGFWRRYRERWEEPLQMLEEIISLSESFGAIGSAPSFQTMDETYWAVLRSLHSRTCLHARAVLTLLSNGLVDPAWAQWRVCHESSTIARFIANGPEMAPRYINYSYVNKYHLAKHLMDSGHPEALIESEFEQLKEIANIVLDELLKIYGREFTSRDSYAWSGLGSFRQIEDTVFEGFDWGPRGEYILASERIHSAPNAGEPRAVGDGQRIFLVGPTNNGLVGPVDLTSFSILAATQALLLNASLTAEDKKVLTDLAIKRRAIGVLCWLRDPAIYCQNCGGHVPGASPPEEIPVEDRPEPCLCPEVEA